MSHLKTWLKITAIDYDLSLEARPTTWEGLFAMLSMGVVSATEQQLTILATRCAHIANESDSDRDFILEAMNIVTFMDDRDEAKEWEKLQEIGRAADAQALLQDFD